MRAPDITLAVRNIFRRPGFAVVAILLLALGAGANTAVFSVVRGVVLRPLAYPQPEQLVAVWPGAFISTEDVVYWRAHGHSFQSIDALSPGWLMGLVVEGAQPIKVTGGRVTDGLFKTLGATAALGRTLEPGDGANGRTQVVVISNELWRSHFNSDPNIVGRSIDLDSKANVIVGVMPRGFEIFQPGTDLWAPLENDPAARTFKATFSQALARMTPEATVDSASADLRDQVPGMRRDLGRKDDYGKTIRVESLQESIIGNVRPAMLIVLGAVGLILMLAAVNLGTLVLGRAIARVPEMAVRTALGASRAQLMRQVVVEQAVLAVLGSIAGAGLAWLSLPALVAQLPPEVPRLGEITLDWPVLATVLVASITVAILVSLVPAALSSRPNLQSLLRQSRSGDTPGRARALAALVSVQIALAVVLGIGASLMLRSLWNLQHVNPGFEPNGVLSFRLQTTSKPFTLTTGLPYMRQVMERVRALPGVTDVGAINHLPLSGYAWTTNARKPEDPPVPGVDPPQVGWRFVDGDYFRVMQIPLKAGRTFTEADTNKSARVTIINETMARKFFGDVSASVGRGLILKSGATGLDEAVEVVGVVGDVRHLGLSAEAIPEIFRPMAQTFMFPMAIVARTSTPPAQLAAAVRQAAFEIDPLVPVAELQPYATLVASTLGRPRLLSFLLLVFAGTGLLLGLVGVYGVVAYRVRQREREIGIRLALGAEPGQMAKGVLAQGLLHALGGLALGLPLAFLLSRVMSSVVFGVTTRDPITFTSLPIAIVAITIVACAIPARRAARVDPVVSIRQD